MVKVRHIRVAVPEARLRLEHAQIEQSGFDGAKTAEAPGGHGHLLDQKILGGPGGLVFGLEGFEQLPEVFLILVVEDGGLGGEAVAQSVEADGVASFGSLRAGAQPGVAAVGVNLTLGGHSQLVSRPMIQVGCAVAGCLRADVVEGIA